MAGVRGSRQRTRYGISSIRSQEAVLHQCRPRQAKSAIEAVIDRGIKRNDSRFKSDCKITEVQS